jgi:dTDP-4-dehydrorhamnose 3,5-epimerase
MDFSGFHRYDLPYTLELTMEVQEIGLVGVKKIRSKIFFDDRGFFRETFCQPLYQRAGIGADFAQDNHSFSKRGTIRGMHFQRFPGQAKLVTVMEGKIFDVVVDIRPSSPTFGKWEGVYLDASLGDQLFVPVGYAHGFCVVSEQAHVCYKVSTVYDPLEERGFRYDDPIVGIQWPVNVPVLSERDRNCPLFMETIQ